MCYILRAETDRTLPPDAGSITSSQEDLPVRTPSDNLTVILTNLHYIHRAETDRTLPPDAGSITSSQEDLPVRTPSDSFSQAIIPLSDAKHRQKYITTHNAVRFGRILENLDTFAGAWYSLYGSLINL